jgi:hypothetical protein
VLVAANDPDLVGGDAISTLLDNAVICSDLLLFFNNAGQLFCHRHHRLLHVIALYGQRPMH